MKILIVILVSLIAFAACTQSEQVENSVVEDKPEKMKIEIWSDVACPFCYIGKVNFEEALNQFDAKDDIEVVWKSYQLDPTPQSELPMDLTMYQYLAQRKGISVKESEKMHDNVTKMAKKVGLEYNFDIAKMSNTFDASRLIHFAHEKGVQNEVKTGLFAAHFTEGLDVADHKVLVQIGEKAGLNGKEIEQMLNSDRFESEVAADISEAGQVGVTGVPFFVIDRKFAISGAQPASSFTEIIEKAYSERSK